jgi:hypothetical protein
MSKNNKKSIERIKTDKHKKLSRRKYSFCNIITVLTIIKQYNRTKDGVRVKQIIALLSC